MLSIFSYTYDVCFLVILDMSILRYLSHKVGLVQVLKPDTAFSKPFHQPASPTLGPQLSQACTPFTRCTFKMTTCKIDHLHKKRERFHILVVYLVASPFAVDSCSWLAPLSTMAVHWQNPFLILNFLQQETN